MQQVMPARPLVRVFVPEAAWPRDAALVVAASLFVALCAQVSIPLWFTPVPVTGQTFGVLLTGAALGTRLGALALLLYLIEGALGLPFYAGGQSGAFWALPSGGYIVGFIFAAALVGHLAERGWDRGPRVILAMVLGNLVIYACGLAWLGYTISGSEAMQQRIPGDTLVAKTLTAGLWPFLVGDGIKIALASALLPAAWKLVGMRKGG